MILWQNLIIYSYCGGFGTLFERLKSFYFLTFFVDKRHLSFFCLFWFFFLITTIIYLLWSSVCLYNILFYSICLFFCCFTSNILFGRVCLYIKCLFQSNKIIILHNIYYKLLPNIILGCICGVCNINIKTLFKKKPCLKQCKQKNPSVILILFCFFFLLFSFSLVVICFFLFVCSFWLPFNFAKFYVFFFFVNRFCFDALFFSIVECGYFMMVNSNFCFKRNKELEVCYALFCLLKYVLSVTNCNVVVYMCVLCITDVFLPSFALLWLSLHMVDK